MVKPLILLLNLVSFSFITFLLSDDIKVTTNMPTEVVQDSIYVVEVIIDKGDVIGFAKFQQNLPQGYEVEPVEVADASFTFADGKVKFIWMAIPEKPQVKVSYSVKATSSAPTTGTAEGKFSYIDNMERKSFDLPNQTIKVIQGESKAEANAMPAMAEIVRAVHPMAPGTYKVSLEINKQGINGFSKIEEMLPVNCSASVITNELSVFSQVGEKAKFVWMSIPEGESFTVSYKVQSDDPNAINLLRKMEGSFSFLENNESKTIAVSPDPSEEVKVEAPAMAEVPKEEKKSKIEEKEKEQVELAIAEAELKKNPEIITEAKAEPGIEPQVASINSTAITSIPSPETGIAYKVQILAGHKVVQEKYMVDNHKFNESFVLDNHEGWVKYITGTFVDYKQARDKRESLIAAQHNFPGPFVTAYNEGQRITVQEALMITNQKWIK